MSIEVQNISKNYGAQKALDNVSFSVKKGEIVGFFGTEWRREIDFNENFDDIHQCR